MDELKRNALHKEETDDIYRSIGEFSVKFEQIVHSMTNGITVSLAKDGLKNQKLSNIILAELTAYPIKSIFASIIAETVDLSDKEKRIVNIILKRIQRLIDERNNIVHRTWFVGWASSVATKFDEVSGVKLMRGKTGGGSKVVSLKSEDFDNLSAECDSVNELVSRLCAVVAGGYAIGANFAISDSGEVVVKYANRK